MGLYTDSRGKPSTSRTSAIVEWEGPASHAAWHAPYLVLFHEHFVEVRHGDSGKLVHVLYGQDIHCTWDGRGVVQGEGADTFADVKVPRIHAAQLDDSGEPETHGGLKRQRVVALMPTERFEVPAEPPSS